MLDFCRLVNQNGKHLLYRGGGLSKSRLLLGLLNVCRPIKMSLHGRQMSAKRGVAHLTIGVKAISRTGLNSCMRETATIACLTVNILKLLRYRRQLFAKSLPLNFGFNSHFFWYCRVEGLRFCGFVEPRARETLHAPLSSFSVPEDPFPSAPYSSFSESEEGILQSEHINFKLRLLKSVSLKQEINIASSSSPCKNENWWPMPLYLPSTSTDWRVLRYASTTFLMPSLF